MERFPTLNALAKKQPIRQESEGLHQPHEQKYSGLPELERQTSHLTAQQPEPGRASRKAVDWLPPIAATAR